MRIEEILLAMGTGLEQSDDAIAAFVRGVVDESVSRPQAAAWLAFAFARTLSTAETVSLTRAMTHSGSVMQWPDGPTLIDKHSTGGVGDKVSLILAPLWAELGLRVPMVSGRGLGHTGGTLDKLESIPGYRTDLDDSELRTVLKQVGAFISGQTSTLAPADRVLYGVRNETQTVASVPLIVGSILSKKLAEGVQHLILDVKVGGGAFMKTVERGRTLAQALVDVATASGVRVQAHLTAMDRPLGEAVGNALEVDEAIACLRGGGPSDLREITLALADHPGAESALDGGGAYERFLAMVEAQGGDPRAVDGGLLGAGCKEIVVKAERAGRVAQVQALGIGKAAFVLGAGRQRPSDPVDFGVGLRVLVAPGDQVDVGQPLCAVLHRDGRGLELALQHVQTAIQIGGDAAEPLPLLMDRIDASSR